MRKTCFLLATSAFATTLAPLAPAAAQPGAAVVPAQTGRTIARLADGWKFRYAAPGDPSRVDYDDAAWSAVQVPHTWNRVGNYDTTRRADANTDRGIGWYRLHFATPAKAADGRVHLEFDAASIIADVWVNGVKLGSHAGAFSRFRFDATDALHARGDNVLTVKVDNSAPAPGSSTRNIVPISGDFFMYGGLYRPVSLIVTGSAQVDLLDHGGPGSYARVTALTDRHAKVAVRTRIRNAATRAARLDVATIVRDAAGGEVARDRRSVSVAAGAVQEVVAPIDIADPHRWNGTADPYLYQTTVEVRDARGRLLDSVRQPLGLREVRIDPAHGFFLNGRKLALHGVTRHQDRQDKGWALSDADHAEDIGLIREMGANAIRLSHYEQAGTVFDLADRDGLILWSEIGLVNLTAPLGQRDTPPEMLASAQAQMVELIRQNYNHPSVAVWGIGNEVTNLSSKKLTPSNARPLMEAVDRVAKQEDPDRPTTIAVCCEPLPGEAEDFRDRSSGTADTVGYNLYLGWYGKGRVGEGADLGPLLAQLHALRPTLPIGIGEYGGGGATSQHTDNPWGGRVENISRPQPEEYQSVLHEALWKSIRPLDFMWGSFAWQMFDATSDLRQEGDSSDINTKGLVSFDRKTRKDAFYFYQAAWSDRPMIQLAGAHYEDRAYRVNDVRAYSNASSATLSVNGTKIGTVACADAVCVWPGVRLAMGANRLVATAAGGAAPIESAIAWRYAGPERAVHIRAGSLTGVRLAGGTRYGSDNYFTGGAGETLNVFKRELYATGAATSARKVVRGTDTPDLFESYRSGGAFDYAVPLENGRYRVTVRGFEPEAQAAGKRVFSLSVGGGAPRRVDWFALGGGALRAAAVTLPAEVRDGTLRLRFHGEAGDALVSAIDVEPIAQ